VSELVAQTGPLPVQLADLLRGREAEPAAGPPVVISPPTPGPRRDILLIQVESLDSGAVDWRLADGAVAMPRLAARAAGGTYWPWCLAYHGPGGSSDGEFAVVNGREPTWKAPVINRRGYAYADSLPRLLAQQGWRSTMALGLYGFFFDYARVQPRVGYAWLGLEELGVVQHEGEFGARDGEFVDAVLARLGSLPRPGLLHCTTMSGHIPWRQWRNLPACAGPALATTGTADDYARTLRYVDLQLDRLIEGFLADRPGAVVVLFGDHTALIDADGYASPSASRDGVQWEFVPVMVLGNGVPVRRVALAASQLDLQRSILRLAGWTGTVASWGMDLTEPAAQVTPLRFHGHDYPRAEIGAWAAGLGRR
jgi:phosphoglycerol transferase MdoB-like AlkP superfamily enzyme